MKTDLYEGKGGERGHGFLFWCFISCSRLGEIQNVSGLYCCLGKLTDSRGPRRSQDPREAPTTPGLGSPTPLGLLLLSLIFWKGNPGAAEKPASPPWRQQPRSYKSSATAGEVAAPSLAGRARWDTRPSIPAGEAPRECRLLAAACALRARARGHRGPEPRPGWGAGRAPRPSLPHTAACPRPPVCTLPPALACRPLDRTGRTAGAGPREAPHPSLNLEGLGPLLPAKGSPTRPAEAVPSPPTAARPPPRWALSGSPGEAREARPEGEAGWPGHREGEPTAGARNLLEDSL